MNLRQLPKIELHRHLELSIRHTTLRELAPQFGIILEKESDFAKQFLVTEPMRDLGSVLNKFLGTQKILATEEILERISFEACEDAFNESIRILELRYAPTFVRQNHDSLSFDTIHQSILRGVQRAEKTFDMAVGLICIIQRILPLKEAEYITDFAIENRESFIGLDLADNEVGFDSKPFAPFFLRAKKAGLGISVHSGEANVAQAPSYVRDAIDYLGADRIGHGVQIYQDESVMDYVKEKSVTLELCPTSNVLTNAVPSLSKHPFKHLMDYGVRTTINSDDPGIFNIDLTHEYEVLQKHFGLTVDDFATCNQYAFEASFIPDSKKKAVWTQV